VMAAPAAGARENRRHADAIRHAMRSLVLPAVQ
jgi:hypothetical protein